MGIVFAGISTHSPSGAPALSSRSLEVREDAHATNNKAMRSKSIVFFMIVRFFAAMNDLL